MITQSIANVRHENKRTLFHFAGQDLTLQRGVTSWVADSEQDYNFAVGFVAVQVGQSYTVAGPRGRIGNLQLERIEGEECWVYYENPLRTRHVLEPVGRVSDKTMRKAMMQVVCRVLEEGGTVRVLAECLEEGDIVVAASGRHIIERLHVNSDGHIVTNYNNDTATTIYASNNQVRIAIRKPK